MCVWGGGCTGRGETFLSTTSRGAHDLTCTPASGQSPRLTHPDPGLPLQPPLTSLVSRDMSPHDTQGAEGKAGSPKTPRERARPAGFPEVSVMAKGPMPQLLRPAQCHAYSRSLVWTWSVLRVWLAGGFLGSASGSSLEPLATSLGRDSEETRHFCLIGFVLLAQPKTGKHLIPHLTITLKGS